MTMMGFTGDSAPIPCIENVISNCVLALLVLSLVDIHLYFK